MNDRYLKAQIRCIDDLPQRPFDASNLLIKFEIAKLLVFFISFSKIEKSSLQHEVLVISKDQVIYILLISKLIDR